MAHLRYVTITSLLTLFSFFTITYTSCTKDKCKDITCGNGGSCSDGACKCVSGYTGARCEVAPDPCKDKVCQHGGVCTDGTCQCPTGYEGTNCESMVNAKFSGIYNGEEHCNSVNNPVVIMITADATDPTKITVSNIGSFYCNNSPIEFEAIVSGNSFTLNGTQCNIHVEATGTISGKTITMSYTYDAGTTSDGCTVTMSKL